MEPHLDRFRMYSIAMRHLSGIQKGIQALHSTIEYINNFQYSNGIVNEDLRTWMLEDKTKVLLEANSGLLINGTILEQLGVNVAYFQEPDFSNALTSISFLLNERLYKKYTDLGKPEEEPDIDFENRFFNQTELQIRSLVSSFRLASN